MEEQVGGRAWLAKERDCTRSACRSLVDTGDHTRWGAGRAPCHGVNVVSVQMEK